MVNKLRQTIWATLFRDSTSFAEWLLSTLYLIYAGIVILTPPASPLYSALNAPVPAWGWTATYIVVSLVVGVGGFFGKRQLRLAGSVCGVSLWVFIFSAFTITYGVQFDFLRFVLFGSAHLLIGLRHLVVLREVHVVQVEVKTEEGGRWTRMLDFSPGFVSLLIAMLSTVAVLGSAWSVYKSKKVDAKVVQKDNIDTQEAEFRAELRQANKDLSEQNKELSQSVHTLEKTNRELVQQVETLTKTAINDKQQISNMASEVAGLKTEIEKLQVDIRKLLRGLNGPSGAQPQA